MTLRCILAILTAAALSACGEIQHQSGPVDSSAALRAGLSRPTALRGWIGHAMQSQVATALAAGHRSFTIDSRGGELDPALEIGRLIKFNAGSLEVDGACMSACVSALMMVPDRRARPGADVRLHRAAAPDGGPKTVARIGGLVIPIDAAQYGAAIYRKLGVPQDLIERDTADFTLRRLSPADLVRMGVQQ